MVDNHDYKVADMSLDLPISINN